jgi:hypothetical protein
LESHSGLTLGCYLGYPMGMPLFFLAVGLLGGYLIGRRGGAAAALRREASALLESVGKMARSGALHRIDDLNLRHGTEGDGVQLTIKTYGASSPSGGPPEGG